MNYYEWMSKILGMGESAPARTSPPAETYLSARPPVEPGQAAISARHPYEITMPYNQVGPFPMNMAAGSPRGEVAYTPEEYGREAIKQALQISPVYHGSPYKFNKFKNEAIGTGEGAQSFGYGHYLSDAPEVASSYKNKATIFGLDPKEFNKKNHMPGNVIEAAQELGTDVNRASEWMKMHERDYDIRRIADSIQSYGPDNAKMMLKNERQEKLFDELVKSGDLKIEGHIYEATLHKGKQPGEYKYLDWYKSVPEDLTKIVKEDLKDGVIKDLKISSDAAKRITEQQNFHSFYSYLSDILGSEKLASKYLKEVGYDGIRYPTGSLSGMKSDKFNYVVFDPEDIAIEAVR